MQGIDTEGVGGLLSNFVKEIDRLASLAEKENPPTLEVGGRHFVRVNFHNYEEVEQLREDLEPRTQLHKVVGIDSLVTTIPIGDPGCEVGIEWLLTAKSIRGELRIDLGSILEPSLDIWAAWARARIEELGVPDGWVVLTVA